jgi:hypothetical protein
MTGSFPKPDIRYNISQINNELLTSIENMTPPIGEPNATATPAALAAVKISRLLPSQVQPPCVNIRDGFGQAHSDCEKIG